MAAAENPRGPASYCPAIEEKYGRPIERWLAIVRGYSGMKHMEMVERLKTEYGLGHGHANAIVAYVLAGSR
jgi:3-oxoacyl-ACP reductase-like protein